MKKYLLFTVIAFLFLGATAQDKVTLTDGRVLKGKISSITADIVTIATESSEYQCPIHQVTSYVKNGELVVPNGVGGKSGDIILKSVGDEYNNASGLFAAGAILMSGGFIASTLSSDIFKLKLSDSLEEMERKQNNAKILRYAGAGLFAIGSILEVSAIVTLSNSGKKLNVFLKENRAGISMNF